MKGKRAPPAARKRSGKRDQDHMVIPRPMQLPNMGMTHDVKRRYTCAANAGYFITYENLLDSILFATTTSQGYQIFDQVKINYIEVWAYSPTIVLTATICYGSKTVGLAGDGKRHTATSMGIEPLYLKAKPAKGCAASLFQSNTTNNAFEIIVPQGAVIDMHCTYRNSFESLAPVAVTQALTTATVGQLYYRGFDGLPIASTKFTPAGTSQVI